MRNLSDLEIIESINKGNVTDFALLVDRYKNKAYSLLKRMLKNEMDAEEVLQDSFMKAFRGLKSFKAESKFSTWFYKIAYNTALTRLSSKRARQESETLSLNDEIVFRNNYNLEEDHKESISLLLNSLVNELPPHYASVINMFYLDEMSCEEISQVMNLTLGNVKVLLYRSRNALREIVNKSKIKLDLI
jgi:RNA polymerase sigma-70 factor (ECF subfamily)